MVAPQGQGALHRVVDLVEGDVRVVAQQQRHVRTAGLDQRPHPPGDLLQQLLRVAPPHGVAGVGVALLRGQRQAPRERAEAAPAVLALADPVVGPGVVPGGHPEPVEEEGVHRVAVQDLRDHLQGLLLVVRPRGAGRVEALVDLPLAGPGDEEPVRVLLELVAVQLGEVAAGDHPHPLLVGLLDGVPQQVPAGALLEPGRGVLVGEPGGVVGDDPARVEQPGVAAEVHDVPHHLLHVHPRVHLADVGLEDAEGVPPPLRGVASGGGGLRGNRGHSHSLSLPDFLLGCLLAVCRSVYRSAYWLSSGVIWSAMRLVASRAVAVPAQTSLAAASVKTSPPAAPPQALQVRVVGAGHLAQHLLDVRAGLLQEETVVDRLVGRSPPACRPG